MTVAVADSYSITMKRKNDLQEVELKEKKSKLAVSQKVEVLESQKLEQIEGEAVDLEKTDVKPIDESPMIELDDDLEEFIFKGQEYVQLSKAKYEGQAENYKKERHQILEAYRNIRQLLRIVDDDLDEETQSHDLPEYSKSDGDFFEFIFRGEEYVQLPKNKYFERRIKLQKGVYEVKFVLKQIRNQLLTLNLDQ